MCTRLNQSKSKHSRWKLVTVNQTQIFQDPFSIPPQPPAPLSPHLSPFPRTKQFTTKLQKVANNPNEGTHQSVLNAVASMENHSTGVEKLRFLHDLVGDVIGADENFPFSQPEEEFDWDE